LQIVGFVAGLAAVFAGAASAVGQPVVPPPPIAAPAAVSPVVPPPAGFAQIPAGTEVRVRILDPLGSKVSTPGQVFQLQLAAPIVVDGVERIPAGALGQGVVVHAARARAAGKAGELVLAARFIEHDGIRIPLRSMKLGGVGEDRSDLAFAVGVAAGMATFFVPGGDINLPAGTEAKALTRVAVPLSPATAPDQPAPSPIASSNPSKQETTP